MSQCHRCHQEQRCISAFKQLDIFLYKRQLSNYYTSPRRLIYEAQSETEDADEEERKEHKPTTAIYTPIITLIPPLERHEEQAASDLRCWGPSKHHHHHHRQLNIQPATCSASHNKKFSRRLVSNADGCVLCFIGGQRTACARQSQSQTRALIISLSLPLIHLAACFALNSVLVDKHTVSWLVSRLLLVQSEREFALQLSRSVSVPLSLSVLRKETVNSGITRAYQLWINYRITFARESFDCGLNRVFTWNNILSLSLPHPPFE